MGIGRGSKGQYIVAHNALLLQGHGQTVYHGLQEGNLTAQSRDHAQQSLGGSVVEKIEIDKIRCLRY